MKQIKAIAKDAISIEIQALKEIKNQIDEGFVAAIEHIYKNNGRIIITGIGKSALIGKKIVATLNSTGSPSIFMHAADAVHGDLGMIHSGDIIICISQSGNTEEIKILISLLKGFDNTIIGITGNKDSYLAKNAHHCINSGVSKEACPNNLAPTSSTTAQMALGDALAICLLQLKGFKEKDFAKYHPGGALGKRLFLRLEDIINTPSPPMVSPEDSLKKVLMSITSGRLGATAVLEDKKVVGIITDGDIRRMLENNDSISTTKAKDIMGKNPIQCFGSQLCAEVVHQFDKKGITQLIVLNDQSQYIGIAHFHDFIREGIL